MNHGIALGTVVNLVGALILAVLGVWLAWIKPRRRTNLLLAAFALLMGAGYALINVFILIVGPPPVGDHPAIQASGLLLVGAAAALAALAIRLPRPTVRSDRRLLVLPAVLAGGSMAAVVAVALAFGPVATVVSFLLEPVPAEGVLLHAFAFALLLLPLRAHRWVADVDAEPQYRQTVLAAAALTLFPGVRFGVAALSIGGGVFGFLLLLPVASAVLWLRVVARARDRTGVGGVRGDEGDDGGGDGTAWTGSRAARDLALLSLAMPVAGLALVAWLGGPVFNESGVDGVVRTLTVLVLAYAILRHQLLGIDVTVRWSISRTTMAAVFVAVFFIVSETAQVLFAQWFGGASQFEATLLGILAAGGLLFALAPIRRFADRIAETAVPTGAVGAGPGDAEAIYRTTAAKFLADGTLTEDEEEMLAQLATRLDIDAARAFELRRTARAEGGGGDGA